MIMGFMPIVQNGNGEERERDGYGQIDDNGISV